MKENIKSTYKSNDTEEWFDKVFTRPIGYMWAVLFRKLDIHPNTVTILSIIIGGVSAWFFMHGSYRTEGTIGLVYSIIGVLLLMWANFYDSADGQLARMTGKKTRLGRILDGAAGEIWFILIYMAIVWRFYNHHELEFGLLGIDNTFTNTVIVTLMFTVLVCYSGFGCHGPQCGMADYYRQIHLYFLKGESGSELSNSVQLTKEYNSTSWRGNFMWKIFLRNYVLYTKTQEKKTPNFQILMQQLNCKYHNISLVPAVFRQKFREKSLPIMKWTNILTFNTRAIMLYLFCIIDLPWMYFLFEIFVMGAICKYMRYRHEQFCRKLLETI